LDISRKHKKKLQHKTNQNSIWGRWNIRCIEDLGEDWPEYRIIDACKVVRMINKGETIVIHGLLSISNLFKYRLRV